MHSIISILAAMLIGTGIGAALSPRSSFLLIGYLIATALGIATIVAPSWMTLALGTAVLLLAQSFQRDPDTYLVRA